MMPSPSAVPTSPAAPPSGAGGRGVVELRRVVKTFDTAAGTFTALDGIDLSIGGGEFVAIVGKSGSGKSTLLNMIAGIDHPTSGEVVVASTPVHRLTESQLATWRGRSLGIVFQFFQLLPTLSVIENVLLAMDFAGVVPGHERLARARALLAEVGVGEHADKLPAALSGGEQQRVAIARAQANDPPVLLADEPTGNLDSRTTLDVIRLFEALVARGKTIVIVTHDRDVAGRASRTVVLSDGRLVDGRLADDGEAAAGAHPWPPVGPPLDAGAGVAPGAHASSTGGPPLDVDNPAGSGRGGAWPA